MAESFGCVSVYSVLKSCINSISFKKIQPVAKKVPVERRAGKPPGLGSRLL